MAIRVLVAEGHASTSREAFDRWLGDDKPACVLYEKFSISDGINLLKSCGAVPVWAHPYLFRGGEVEEVLIELIEAGLMGVEVYHPNHTPSQMENLKRLCAEYNLIITGGSDYHGPTADLKATEASSLNMLNLPLQLLGPVKEAAQNLKKYPV